MRSAKKRRTHFSTIRRRTPTRRATSDSDSLSAASRIIRARRTKPARIVLVLCQDFISSNSSFVSSTTNLDLRPRAIAVTSTGRCLEAYRERGEQGNNYFDHHIVLRCTKIHLRKIVASSWYGQVVLQILSLRSSITREELIRSLGIKSGAAEGDANVLGNLVDLIIYTGLVDEQENGTLTRGNVDAIEGPKLSKAPELMQRLHGDLHEPNLQVNAANTPSNISAAPTLMPLRNTDSMISMTLHLHIKDFSELTSENAVRLRDWLKEISYDAKPDVELTNKEDELLDAAENPKLDF